MNLNILEDVIIENDESFSIILERNSSVSTTVPLLIEPEMSTVKIMDNDGINNKFFSYKYYSVQFTFGSHHFTVLPGIRPN